jgi:cobalt/nickel transport system ATP-binding protein
MPALIEATGVRYQYEDGTLALDGVDFHLDSGETLVLLGSNGSGKTTFLLHLNGLLRGEGTVVVTGLPVERRYLPIIRRRVGIVFQDPDEQILMPSVLEDVAYGPLNLGLSPEKAEQKARSCLRAVGLDALADRPPYHLSGGEKRKVAIAGILAMEPEILLLDEPTTSLDPPSQRDLVKILRQLPQAKIVATHNMAFARAIGTRAVFFERGKVAGEGTVEEMIEQFGWGINPG